MFCTLLLIDTLRAMTTPPQTPHRLVHDVSLSLDSNTFHSPNDTNNNDDRPYRSPSPKNKRKNVPHKFSLPSKPSQLTHSPSVDSKQSISNQEDDKDSTGDQANSNSTVLDKSAMELKAAASNRGPGWYRDDINIRAFEEGDNDDVRELEKSCCRGGISAGAFLKSGTVKDKTVLYLKHHLIVGYKTRTSVVQKSRSSLPKFGSRKKQLAGGEEICGFAFGSLEKVMLNGDYVLVGSIIDLFVHGLYRRRNLASRMFQELEARMKRVGVSVIMLRIPKDNDAAMQLFRRHGFSELLELRVIGWQCHVSDSLDLIVSLVNLA